MKVIDGKFKKRTPAEDVPLADKIMASLAQIIDEETMGNFVMLLDVGGDEIMIATDTSVADAVFLLEAAKLNLIMQPLSDEVFH